MKKVVKKMANGGAKKSPVPTPGMAYKEKGRANQMAMATGIPASSFKSKTKTKTPVSKGPKVTRLPEVTITAKRKTSAPVAKTTPKVINKSGIKTKVEQSYSPTIIGEAAYAKTSFNLSNKNKKGTTTEKYLRAGDKKANTSVTQKSGSTTYKPRDGEYVRHYSSKSGNYTDVNKGGNIETYNRRNNSKTTKFADGSIKHVSDSGKVFTKPATTPKAKTVTKPTSGSATNKPAGKTVAQMWQEKTGTSWSEAKKQGLTDGSAKGNMKLMADMKANPSNFSKRDAVPEKLATISAKKAAENLSPAKPTPELAKSSIPFKEGKSRLEKAVASKVGQMKKGGMVKKKK